VSELSLPGVPFSMLSCMSLKMQILLPKVTSLCTVFQKGPADLYRHVCVSQQYSLCTPSEPRTTLNLMLRNHRYHQPSRCKAGFTLVLSFSTVGGLLGPRNIRNSTAAHVCRPTTVSGKSSSQLYLRKRKACALKKSTLSSRIQLWS